MNRPQLLLAGTRTAVAAATVLAATAAAVAVRFRPGPLGFTLALLAVAFLSVPLVGAAAAQAAFTPGSTLPGGAWAGWLDGWPWVPAIAVVPTVGLLLFPTGRPPSTRW